MRGFETGTHYLRKVALEEGLIAASDNDVVLVQRLVKLIKRKDPKVPQPIAVVVKEEDTTTKKKKRTKKSS